MRGPNRSLSPPAASPGASSCSRLKAEMSLTDTSSWCAIQASVRPCRTQVRIWLSCGLSERRAKEAEITNRVLERPRLPERSRRFRGAVLE